MSKEHHKGPRNSPLREWTNLPAHKTTELLHWLFPDLTANEISFGAAAGNAIGAGLAALHNMGKGRDNFQESLPSTLVLTVSALGDQVDGEMQRLREKENPAETNPHGQVIDSSLDGFNTLVKAESRAIAAFHRGGKLGKLGEILAYGAAISGAGPRVVRALAESNGVIVPESGKGFIGFLGTHPGRTILDIPATAQHEILIGKVRLPIQIVLDALAIGANAYNSIDRVLDIWRANGSTVEIDEAVREPAKKRLKVVGAQGVATCLAAFLTYKGLRISGRV